MSKDPRDKEEEFIAGLAEDTGRDLRQWMALIDANTFGHRNEMIDWLRQQGLTFAKASRLERIHHNGGKPVYGDKPPVRIDEGPPRPGQSQQASDPPLEPSPQPPVPQAAKAPSAPAVIRPPQTQVANAPAGDLTAFLARAKGYRPLAELLIRSIRAAVPATAISVTTVTRIWRRPCSTARSRNRERHSPRARPWRTSVRYRYQASALAGRRSGVDAHHRAQ